MEILLILEQAKCKIDEIMLLREIKAFMHGIQPYLLQIYKSSLSVSFNKKQQKGKANWGDSSHPKCEVLGVLITQS